MQFPDVISSRNQHAFVERSCKWYFVEQIAGEFEDGSPGTTLGPIELRPSGGMFSEITTANAGNNQR
jgi:hypothetical protein